VGVWPPAGITSFPSTWLHPNFATNGNKAFHFLENQMHQQAKETSESYECEKKPTPIGMVATMARRC
jgi:hypothetical protein